MVVHREAEQDHEQEDRKERDDAAGRLEAEQLLPPAVLEDEHEDPVGGGDREQVEDDRLRCDHERAEGEEQEQEREAEHEGEHERRDGLHVVVEVLRLGGESADGDFDAGNEPTVAGTISSRSAASAAFDGPSLPLPAIGIAMFATVPSSLTSTRIGWCIRPVASACRSQVCDRLPDFGRGHIRRLDDDVGRDLGAGERGLEAVVRLHHVE